MKKIFALLLTAVLFTQGICKAEGVSISARSAVVIDAQSGKILYKKNEKEKLGMASTTKIMTAVVALEEGSLNDTVTVSPHAADVEGSSMYLKAGEKITLENLVYGLMLSSGNDAATAIAEHIAKSEKAFAKLMNEKAREIGANSTNFTNPHGLSDKKHYTTAQDLAKITAYALKNKDFARIVATKSKTLERESIGRSTLVNHNKLLKTYEGCIGVKTGFTKATGRCLVSAANRNGLKIICVTLNAGDDWNDHKNLCDYVFGKYKATLYKREGTSAGTVKVKGGTLNEVGLLYGEDIRLLEENEGEWEILLELPKRINAPIQKGQLVGTVIAEHYDGERREYKITAEKDIIRKYNAKNNNFNENAEKIYVKWLEIFVLK